MPRECSKIVSSLARILLAHVAQSFYYSFMAGLSQTQTLSQSQVLAPQLQQSLQMQVPMLELRNLIQQELQANPTLEEEIMEPTIEDKQAEHDEFQEEFDRLAKLDEEWRDYMSQSQSYSGRSAEDEERRQFFFDSIVGQQTLQQHLFEQVQSSDLNPNDHQLAELSLVTSTMRVF